jgi:hypothetical protein
MTAANDHLTTPAVEDLDGFTLRAIDWILGMNLSLEWTDLRVLFRGELELELQPISVTTSPNDESSGEWVETVLGNLVDGSFAIKVN